MPAITGEIRYHSKLPTEAALPLVSEQPANQRVATGRTGVFTDTLAIIPDSPALDFGASDFTIELWALS